MTDNEIIKALERCPQHTECCYCNSLEECGSKRILITAVFDLINRQKAENEELQRKILSCNTKIEVLQEVKEQLEKDVFNAQMNLDSIVYEYELLKQEKTVVQSEAIKEFAERLKDDMRLDEECKYNCISCCYECKEFVPQITNLVKEMTEVENDRA